MKKIIINKTVLALLGMCLGLQAFVVAQSPVQDYEYFVHLSPREKELLADAAEEKRIQKVEAERVPFWFEFWKRHPTKEAAQAYRDKLARSRQKHRAKKRKRQQREHEKDEHRLAQVNRGKQYLADQKKHRLAALAKRQQQRKDNRALWLQAQPPAAHYADLYTVPAWPNSFQFYENDMQVIIQMQYQYADACYDAAGSDTRSNITKLAFGDQPIRVQDALLASKLMRTGVVVQAEPAAYFAQTAADNYLNYFADQVITISGQMQRYQASIDLSKYFFNERMLVGLNVPVVYGSNRLHVDMQRSEATRERINRYDGYANLFARDIFQAKGFTRLGGQEIGLGDFSFYVTAALQSKRVEKAFLGLTLTVPTAKQANPEVLWEPELGNGGFFQLTLDGAVLMHYNTAINPHGMVSFSGFIPAHQKQRVPKKVILTGDARGATLANVLHGQPLAFADRISFNQIPNINDYDTAVRGLGDTVSWVRITKGPVLKLRLGNVFEHCLTSRGTLDVYYDLQIKARDAFGGLDRTIYNFGIMQEGTDHRAHTFGAYYTYQCDHDTRLRFGTQYIFAGKNVPKLFEFTGAVNYSF